ncbi:MAG: hypothetical protein CM1200mP4_3770 [Rhodospirillaceae bacterium]|nr:MAG: hypothetical protein CM1200mP4_3770 [Rhodospirillaceae bacterium]
MPGNAQDPQKLVEDSAALAKSLLADPVWAIYQEQFRKAKGVVIAPDILKAGLLGGQGGGSALFWHETHRQLPDGLRHLLRYRRS